MFIFFLLLTIFFGLVLITGFVWGLVVRGKTSTRSGQEVGVEILAGNRADDNQEPGKKTLVRRTWFRGKGVEVDRNAEYSYAELKRMIGDGRYTEALPALLIMAGIVGLTFFLGLTLIIRGATLIPGLLCLAFSFYSAYLILAGFIKDGS